MKTLALLLFLLRGNLDVNERQQALATLRECRAAGLCVEVEDVQGRRVVRCVVCEGEE